jgi:pilus assembly protein CpaC
LDVFVTALRQNNLLRVLAEPNLTAISGQEASFLAGGEFPIPVPQAGGSGNAAITVEYKQFGVRLNFVPVVMGDGKIRLKVSPEVSDLDFSRSVTLQGFSIPSLTKRNVTTTIEMSEGQTFAVAGLLNNRVTSSKHVVPVLGDIPVLGALFRSVRYERNETELVVLVTPRLVEPLNPSQVPPLPGETWRYPTEADLFWKRDLGGPGADAPPTPADKKAPARFRGQYGFTAVE